MIECQCQRGAAHAVLEENARDLARRYLAGRKSVLWGQFFDIITNLPQAEDWLAQLVVDLAEIDA